MEHWLKPGEEVHDLQYKGLKIFASPGQFGVSTDAVLLAGFVHAGSRDVIVDLGCGTGVLSLLLNARTNAQVIGIDINIKAADMARRAAAANRQHNVIIHTLDNKDAPNVLGHGCATVVVVNPPYHAFVDKSANQAHAAAKHEGSTRLEEVVNCAAKLLQNGGRFFCCYPPSKLVTLFSLLRHHNLEPKQMRMVRSKPEASPWLVLLEAKKGGRPGLFLLPELVLTDAKGNMTEEAKQIYHIARGPNTEDE